MKKAMAASVVLCLVAFVAPGYCFMDYLFGGSSGRGAIDNSAMGDLRAWWTGNPAYQFNPYYSGQGGVPTGQNPQAPAAQQDYVQQFFPQQPQQPQQGQYGQQYMQPGPQGYGQQAGMPPQQPYPAPMQGYPPPQQYQQPQAYPQPAPQGYYQNYQLPVAQGGSPLAGYAPGQGYQAAPQPQYPQQYQAPQQQGYPAGPPAGY